MWFAVITIFVMASTSFSQQSDSLQNVVIDTTKLDSNKTIYSISDSSAKFQPSALRNEPYLKTPTLPPMHLSDKNNRIHINSTADPFRSPAEKFNYDALNMPTRRTDYEITNEYIQPKIPITPLEIPKEKLPQPLTYDEYIIPTRQELDILQVLWTKEDVMDTTIYSCLDTTLNITMEDLNKLLTRMTHRGLVYRRQVSPRFEFNAFGIGIEMSMQNRRNKVYEYHSNVDQEVMQRFINANAYLFKEDSSIVDQSQLRAVQDDATLLEDLDRKMHLPKK
jgi:predicted transcriptional regulator